MPDVSRPDIRAARARLGLSQRACAALLGVPSDTLARWERGDLTIRHPQVLRLALERLEQCASRAAE